MPILHKKSRTSLENSDPSQPILKIDSLRFTYPGGQQALNGISFSISQGEKVALVGHNGSGKSTLLLNLIGILNGKGEIQISGLEKTEENLPIIRSKIGLVFQNPDDQLFSPTVFADVAFGPIHMGYSEQETIQRVRSALSAIGMSDYSDRLSYHLSTGEKKRVAIATILSMDPELIVLDEPTAGLDPKARRALITLLRELPQSMLVATHDLLMVKELLPRTIILDHGTIVADGSTKDILDNSALLDSHGLEMPI